MKYKYWLPDENGNKKDYETETGSIVIIGANGSGKSKLGAWIEQQDYSEVHRIGAQRNLNFNENIALKSYSQAEDLVFFGTDDKNNRVNKVCRWDWGQNYTTKLMDDFENVLAALIGLKNYENDKFIEEYRNAESTNGELPKSPQTSIDKLQKIWNEVLPERYLVVDDSKFYAEFECCGEKKRYSANQMSDGERAVLYLAAQVLCVPSDKVLIIDEPEIHLHPSIVNRLWHSLEKQRLDCLFIYITHDVQFAAQHSNSEKIWIKDYDGENWSLETITGCDLPEELLFEILGARKNIIFVEGEANSYDTQLYSEIFSGYHIIACGSCTQVIARTRAFNANMTLHNCQVYGIIDRDYRTEHEIESLAEDNVYTLQVAEVENLFIVEEIIRVIAKRMAQDDNEVFDKIKDYVIQERFKKQIEQQIYQNVVAEIKYRLTCIDLSGKSEIEIEKKLNDGFSSIDFNAIKEECEEHYKNILNSQDYKEVIKVFNEKNIAKSLGQYFGLNNNRYCSFIISLLHNECREKIIDAILPYLPAQIPR